METDFWLKQRKVELPQQSNCTPLATESYVIFDEHELENGVYANAKGVLGDKLRTRREHGRLLLSARNATQLLASSAGYMILRRSSKAPQRAAYRVAYSSDAIKQVIENSCVFGRNNAACPSADRKQVGSSQFCVYCNPLYDVHIWLICFAEDTDGVVEDIEDDFVNSFLTLTCSRFENFDYKLEQCSKRLQLEVVRILQEIRNKHTAWWSKESCAKVSFFVGLCVANALSLIGTSVLPVFRAAKGPEGGYAAANITLQLRQSLAAKTAASAQEWGYDGRAGAKRLMYVVNYRDVLSADQLVVMASHESVWSCCDAAQVAKAIDASPEAAQKALQTCVECVRRSALLHDCEAVANAQFSVLAFKPRAT